MAETLLDDLASLLRDAAAASPSPEVRDQLMEAEARLHAPLRVAIAGKVKAGKSTLLNGLVGEELAQTAVGECTKIVTWYQNAHTYRVLLHEAGKDPVQVPFKHGDGALEIDLDGRSAAEVERLEVWWPSRRLERITLIDTPGIGSISTDVSERTLSFLSFDDDRPAAADAVIYLMRHLHSTDVRFLESFHDDELGQAMPINAIGVLSRADEIGACRVGAMEAAARVAARYDADPKVRRLCQLVIPVAGLLGQSGATLREDEFRWLAMVAHAPRNDATNLLLSADRFVQSSATVSVGQAERQRLISRFGLFGVRLSVELIRTGVASTAPALAADLVERSGFERLRRVLVSQFADRGRVLKARSALVTLHSVLEGASWPGADHLRGRTEMVAAGAHEIQEIRLLNQVRVDELGLRPEQTEEMEHLLGAWGESVTARLGLDEAAPPAAVHEFARAALARWSNVAEHPMSSPSTRLAARTVARSCEGILARAPEPTARKRDDS